jgi:hypothetical protein
MLLFLEGVMVIEDLLKRLVESQDRTEKRLIESQNRNEKQFTFIQNDLHTLKSDVRDIKEAVNRIEEHQEETIMSTLTFIKKQNEGKNSQLQVLNKRLFEVESKVEEAQKS